MPWSLMLISLIALCNAHTEIKLNGKTSQSSDYISENVIEYSSERAIEHGSESAIEHGSEKAIDGDKETCSRTGKQMNSWWRIDLLGVYRIDSIKIYNEQQRRDPDITGAQIYIGNSQEKNATTNCLCKNITNFEIGDEETYECDTNVSGRYITVFFPKKEFLILCDVKIYGTIKESPFELISENKTWGDALDSCRERGMNLAFIVDEETQTWAELKAKTSTSPFVWLGLRYTCTLNFWFWVDYLPLQFSRLSSDSKTDDCNMSGAMDKQGKHLWFSKHATEEYNFICAY